MEQNSLITRRYIVLYVEQDDTLRLARSSISKRRE